MTSFLIMALSSLTITPVAHSAFELFAEKKSDGAGRRASLRPVSRVHFRELDEREDAENARNFGRKRISYERERTT